MRLLVLAALLAIPAAAAHADVVADARSATAACLSAVIDGAPVGDIEDGPIAIRRGKEPVTCTVTISDGEPVIVREAVMAAISRRTELFKPTKTRWNPEAFAAREAFCNLSVRRHLSAVVSTGRPGMQPVAVVTVFEGDKRDPRCDRDVGLQKSAAAEAPVPAATGAPPVQEIAPPAPKAKKKGWLPRLPGRKG